MTARRILASVSPGEVRVALLEDGVLTEAWFDRPWQHGARVGDIHRARITARAPAMGGAFVTLAGGETGFLPDTESDAEDPKRRAEALAEGRVLPVRVTRAPQGGKGPRVSARLTAAEQALTGDGAVLARGPDATLRLALAWPAADVIADDAALVARLRPVLGQQILLTRGRAFDEALEAAFAGLAEAEVPLPGGGRLLIQPTAGLTAIDIDAGTAAGGNENARRSVNEAALAEAARQIRLRNMGGAILLDPAGLKARARAALADTLRAGLATDPLKPRVLGITGLGLIEVVRPRVHAPLHELLATPAMAWPPSLVTRALAALRQAARDSAARPGVALALRASPSLATALRGMTDALADYAAGSGRGLVIVEDALMPSGGWVLDEAGR